MDQMTLGQFIGIAVAIIAGLVGFIKGIEYLAGKVGKTATNWLQKGLEPVNKKLDAIDKKVVANELESNKTILVRFLADIKNGEKLTDIETERLHETYERYTQLGGNSYIHTEWERLTKEGKI